MGDVLEKVPCPQCRERGADQSGDNLVKYVEGGAHCFACGYTVQSKTEVVDDDPGTTARNKKRCSSRAMVKEFEYRRLAVRGITEETCKFFGYAIGKFNGQTVHIAQYQKGTVRAQKLRFKNKDFRFLGAVKGIGLYGQHLWRDGGKQVVITEGEIDTLTVSQLQNNKWPVVSVPNGAQGASKTIAQEIEWLEQFEKVIFMFDMDEPGQTAALECAELLSPGKAYIARLPKKDPNECLLEGYGKEVIDAMWNAKAFRPDGVVDIAALCEEASSPIEVGLPWPWPSLTDKTYGRRRGELYGFGGGTGCGKSTIFKQIATFVNETEGLPIGGIFLEEPAKLTAKTLAGMKMRQRVHVPGVDYDRELLKATLQGMSGKVFLYDHFGSMGWDTIKQRIRYMAVACGIKDIFLDHLTALAAAVDDDERKAIDKIMAELSALCQELDITIYYISHLTTPSVGKPHEEGGRVYENQFRGSRSIAYWSHFMFGIERNKQSSDPTIFRVLKDRYTGDAAGLKFGLQYDLNTGLLHECDLPEKGSADKHGFKNEEEEEY
ncbi:toprim domain-containing protein [Microbulbifer sp. 2201CG32-9]|uniref:toprim domain-containing protein n=1 Tax=Microbulbifer sp. 2201CG32-9 TaxID=3232309 RepID=UPI00345BEB7A